MPAENGCGLCKIKVDNLSVVRDGDILLKDVNFELHCGELTSFIGVNGAGKTTLLRALLGEMKHDGTVTYESHDGKTMDKLVTGYVPQFLDFDRSSPVSVYDFLLAARTLRPVAFFGCGKAKADIDKSLESAGALDLRDKVMGDLSGGELQRVMLAQALYPTPELLILDEPLSGVDCVGSEQFYDSIEKLRAHYHISIVMVSHDLDLVKKYSDRVMLIDRGISIQGTVDEVFGSPQFASAFHGGVC